MAKKPKPRPRAPRRPLRRPNIRGVIAEALADQGRSIYWLAIRAGLSYTTAHGALVSGRNFSVETAEAMLGALGVDFAPRARRRARKRRQRAS